MGKEIKIKKMGKIEDVSVSKIESNPFQTRERIAFNFRN